MSSLMMHTNTMKRIWAMGDSVFGKDAEYYLHAFSIVRFGKISLRFVTEEEATLMVSWLDCKMQRGKNA